MKTYDERRQDTEPCLGNCGMLVTDPPRYCPQCETLRAMGSNARAVREWRRLAARPDAQGGTE